MPPISCWTLIRHDYAGKKGAVRLPCPSAQDRTLSERTLSAGCYRKTRRSIDGGWRRKMAKDECRSGIRWRLCNLHDSHLRFCNVVFGLGMWGNYNSTTLQRRPSLLRAINGFKYTSATALPTSPSRSKGPGYHGLPRHTTHLLRPTRW